MFEIHIIFVACKISNPDENRRVAWSNFLNCIKRWIDRAPHVTKGHIAPFTPTGDLNDALFAIYQSVEDQNYQSSCEPFDCSGAPEHFSAINSDLSSSFTEEQADDYFARLIRKTRPINDMETKLEANEIAWKSKSTDQTDDKFVIGDELKSPQEMQKLHELDDPNRVWTKTRRGAKKFIQQKIKNILEFQELCGRLK